MPGYFPHSRQIPKPLSKQTHLSLFRFALVLSFLSHSSPPNLSFPYSSPSHSIPFVIPGVPWEAGRKQIQDSVRFLGWDIGNNSCFFGEKEILQKMIMNSVGHKGPLDPLSRAGLETKTDQVTQDLFQTLPNLFGLLSRLFFPLGSGHFFPAFSPVTLRRFWGFFVSGVAFRLEGPKNRPQKLQLLVCEQSGPENVIIF